MSWYKVLVYTCELELFWCVFDCTSFFLVISTTFCYISCLSRYITLVLMVRLSATFRLLWHCIPKSRFLFTFIRILLLALAILPLCWQYFRVIVTCQTSIQSHSFVKLPPRNCFILFVTDCECGILSSVFVLISRVV